MANRVWFVSQTINSFCRLVATHQKPRTNERTNGNIYLYKYIYIARQLYTERESISVSGLISWPIVSSIAILHCRRRDGCLVFFSFSLRASSVPPFFICVYIYTLCVCVFSSSFAFICHDWPIDPTVYTTPPTISLTLFSIRLLAIDPTLADIYTTTTHTGL